jgi:hypothetical protein
MGRKREGAVGRQTDGEAWLSDNPRKVQMS